MLICVLSFTINSFYREEPIDYGDLDTALRKTCAKMNLKDVEGISLGIFNFFFHA